MYSLLSQHRPTIFGSWVKRYFRVNVIKHTLEYFEAKPTDFVVQKPKESFDLRKVDSIVDFGDLKFELRIQKTVYMLQAESQAEHACWLNHMNAYINERNEYEALMRTKYSLNA